MENSTNTGDEANGNDGKAKAATNKGRISSTEQRQKPWPLRDIKEPHENDVLYGRGGGTNHHVGNKRYRKMVEDRKLDYVNSKRLDKPLIACEIIRGWRAQDPSGRFLKQSETTGMWVDVGDRKAREKTSQALREKAPLIRKQQEEKLKVDEGQHDSSNRVIREVGNDSDYHPSSEDDTGVSSPIPRPRVGFSDPPESYTSHSTKDSKPIKRSVLMRDHSLGREYLKPNESITIEGFSWDGPSDNLIEKKEEKLSTSHPAAQPAGPAHAPPPCYQKHFKSVPPAKPLKGREHSLAANPLANVETNASIDPRFIGWDNPNPVCIFPPPLKNNHQYPGSQQQKDGMPSFSPNNSATAIEHTNSGGSSSKYFPETNSLYRSWSGEGMMNPYGHESSFRSTSGQSDDYRRPQDPILYSQFPNNMRFPSAPLDDNVVFSRASSIQSEDFKQPLRANSFPPPFQPAPFNRPPVYPEPSLEREVSLNFPNSVFENPENEMPPPNWGAVSSNYYDHTARDTPHSSFTDIPITPQPLPRPPRSTSRMSWEATMTLNPNRNKRSSSITAQQSQAKKVEVIPDDSTKPSSASKPEIKRDMSVGTFLNDVFDGPSNSSLPDVKATPLEEKTSQVSVKKDNCQSPPNLELSPTTKQKEKTSSSSTDKDLNSYPTSNESSTSISKDENNNNIDFTSNEQENTNASSSPKPLQLTKNNSFTRSFLDDDVDKALERPSKDSNTQSGPTVLISEASDHDDVTSVEPSLDPPFTDWINQSNSTSLDCEVYPLVSRNNNNIPSDPSTVKKTQNNTNPIVSANRPNPIKRATSNQNEDIFTKRDSKVTKRMPISRDESQSTDVEDNSSSTDNQITTQNYDAAMKRLSFSMGNNKLIDSSNKPSILKETDRVSTIDIISADMKSWIENI